MDPNQPYYYSMQPGPYPVPYRPMMPVRPGFMPGGMPPPQTIIGPNGVPYMVPYGVPPGAMVPPMMGMGMPMYRPGGPLAPAGGKNGPPSPNAAPAQLQGQPPAGQQNSPQSAGQPPQMMSGYRPPPPGAVPEGYASPQSRPPYIVAPGVPGPPHEGMYQPGMMAYPPQGYYPGHTGMMMPIVWTGDPMQMGMSRRIVVSMRRF
ncbi:hypothetical protein BC830DRAFT_92425 [Chytriomyces sp. MP71]|nr:hypothetical protein BC830DRAFT_92425 [Chytriomyces sp. MP71]